VLAEIIEEVGGKLGTPVPPARPEDPDFERFRTAEAVAH
jgi:hypothetical protein